MVTRTKAKRYYDPERAGCLCSICPLRDSKTMVPPVGPADADVMIVGETPGFKEVQAGEPFVGPSGMVLNDILWELGLKRDRIWISNTILCRPEVPGIEGPKKYEFKSYLAYIRKRNAERKKAAHAHAQKGEHVMWDPIPSPIDCCAPRLWAELAHFENVARARGEPNGIVVLPMGNYAAEAITGKAGIMKLRGSPFTIDLEDPRSHLHDPRFSPEAQKEQVRLRHGDQRDDAELQDGDANGADDHEAGMGEDRDRPLGSGDAVQRGG